jgi:hypothetical protein
VRLFTNQQDLIYETKIKPKIKMIYDMKVNGLSDKYIAQALGITTLMFQKIKDNYPLLKNTYDDAMELLCSQLNDVVVKRALGTDGRVDKDGNLLPPDEKLAFRLLEKFDPRYKTKSETQIGITIEELIRQVNNRTTEAIEQEDD